MIKYYIIPVNGNDGYEAAHRISMYQDVLLEDIVILSPDDLSQVFKVPYLQGYKGLGLLVKSCEYLSKNIDVESMISKDNTMVFDLDKNVFIINCESPLIINAFPPRVVESVDLSQFLAFERIGNPNDWILDESLDEYFNCNQDDIIDVREPEQDVFDDVIRMLDEDDTAIFEENTDAKDSE